MAQPADTYDTYDQIGIREDLKDIISLITPFDTPFLTRAGEARADNTLFEWQTDTLAAAVENAVIEGDDATTDAMVATVRLNNRTQISDKVVLITGTAQSVKIAGRPNEMDYQLMKNARELKRDMETVLTANRAKAAGSSSVARRTAGVPTWIATNDSFGATGASPAGTGADTRTDGTQRNFAEAHIRAVRLLCYNSGGEPDVLMVGPFNAQAITGNFTGGATRNIDATEKKLVNAITVMVDEFGTYSVVPNRLQRARDAFLLDMSLWKVAYLRDYQVGDLAKTGDSTRKQLLVEYGLMCMNEAGNGGVLDLTTS